MTWALGAFLNTGSFSTGGEARDQLSDVNGFNITGRLMALPWYEDNGRRLFHLDLSYTFQSRDEDDEDALPRFRTRPESRLTDERFVDTGSIATEKVHRINSEIAIVCGPLSFQGESMYSPTLVHWRILSFGDFTYMAATFLLERVVLIIRQMVFSRPSFTAGLNWYLKSKNRIMFNYIRANVEDRASPFADDDSADIFQARFQISL